MSVIVESDSEQDSVMKGINGVESEGRKSDTTDSEEEPVQ